MLRTLQSTDQEQVESGYAMALVLIYSYDGIGAYGDEWMSMGSAQGNKGSARTS